MAEIKNNNIRIIITEAAEVALSNLEKKFNLVETDEELIKRNSAGQYSKMVFISILAKDFAKKLVLEKDMPALIQKDLGVTPQIANDITKEIITKVVPLLEKFSEDKIKEQAEAERMIGIPTKKTDMSEILNKAEKPEPIIEENPKIPKQNKQIAEKPVEKKSSGSDTYREPIE